MPYQESDADFFFGREAERDIISDNLLAWRLTLLYGASGVGKSSVLNAGAAHHLRKLSRNNLRESGTPKFIVVVFNSWRDDPVPVLDNRIRETVSALYNKPMTAPAPRGFTELLKAWTERLDADLLIILDQFEDYFLYHPLEDSGGFAEEFAAAVNRRDLRASFLISIREDSVAKLDVFKGRIPHLFENYLRLEHLSREAARWAIEKPIQTYNSKEGAHFGIEPDLVSTVLDFKPEALPVGNAGIGMLQDAGPRPAEAPIEAPYLQLVMTRLWEEETSAGSQTLRLETLERLGGVEHIVKTHIDEMMRSLLPAEQDIAARVFHQLVTPSGAKIAHYPRDLANYAGLSEKEIAPVLEKLCGSGIRILRPVADAAGGLRYEIFHDRLAAAILDWTTRYARAAEAEQQRRELGRAKADAIEQKRRAEQQTQVAARMRQFALGLGVLALMVILAAVLAFIVQRKAHALDRLFNSHRLAAVAVNQLETDPQLGVLLAMHAVSTQASPPALDALNRSLIGLHLQNELRGHSDRVTAVDFSPDGKLLASGSYDRTVKLWEANTGQLLRTLTGHADLVRVVAFSPDSTLLLTASDDKSTRLFNVATSEYSIVWKDEWISGIAFSPNGKLIATTSWDGAVRIRDANGRRELKNWKDGSSRTNDLAFNQTGVALATAGGDRLARIWAVSTGRKTHTLEGHTDQVMRVAFSKDDRFLASAGMDRTIRIWNQEGKNLYTITGHTNSVFAVAFNEQGRLASASADGRVKLWDPTSGRELLTFVHTNPVEGIAFSRDGKRLASASWDHTVKIWRTDCHADGIKGIAFSPDGTQVATASYDKTIKLWDAASGQELRTFKGHLNAVNVVVFSPTDKWLASGSDDGQAIIWDSNSGQALQTITTDYGINDVAFTPDGRLLATTSADGTLALWDTGSGKLRSPTFTKHVGDARFVSFSPDGRLVATSGDDGKVMIREVASGMLRDTIEAHQGEVFFVKFSPDARYLATGGIDGTVNLWSTSGNKLLHTFKGHGNLVTWADFSPDSTRLATASYDRTARIWNVASGQEENMFVHNNEVNSVAFSPDGTRLATASEDKTVHIYLLRPSELMNAAAQRMRRLGRAKLTDEECRKYLQQDRCQALP